MARKRSRRKGTGSIIRVRRLGQLKKGELAQSAMPVIIGGGTAAVTTIAVHQMTPTSPMQLALVRNAPWVGVGVGVLASLAVWNLQNARAGAGALTAAITVGIGLAAVEYAAGMRMGAGNGNGNAVAGVGAIVPEYGVAGAGRGGMGAIAMEPHASRGYGAGPLGSYGEVVNLGQVNASAFGTPGFTVG
jgi:hypothetical protein